MFEVFIFTILLTVLCTITIGVTKLIQTFMDLKERVDKLEARQYSDKLK